MNNALQGQVSARGQVAQTYAVTPFNAITTGWQVRKLNLPELKEAHQPEELSQSEIAFKYQMARRK